MKTAALLTAAWTVGVFAVACASGPSEADCGQAAAKQAEAEEWWTEQLEIHVQADKALADVPESKEALDAHDLSAENLRTARVDMILAEAATRRGCG